MFHRGPGGGGGPRTVVRIPYENHNLAAIEAGAPHLMAFAAAGALATNFTSPLHPSLPNYMDFSGGGNPNGITSDCDPCMVGAKSLWDAVEAAGQTIECYAKSLASTKPPYDYNGVYPGAAVGPYDNHHVWPVHYSLIMGNATRKAKIKDLSALSLSALPNYTELVPNTQHEMHGPVPGGGNVIAAGDAWAQANFPAIIAAADLTICWFDEGKGPLYVAFYGKLAKPGVRSNVAYTNADLCATVCHVLGIPIFGSGTVMTDMLVAGA